jgi:RHS repeat-associated protein
MVDAKGNPARIHFDGVGQMTKRERALTLGATINDFTAAQVTEWGRDLNGRLGSHKDDGTNETTWTYDALDRVEEMEYPDTSTIAYEYDKNDNVTEITDAAGNVIEDTFDVRNLNTSRSVTLATGFGGTTSETRTFDALGRLLTAADNDYKVTLTYGVRGMASTPYEETQEYVGGTAYAVTVTKTQDAVGRKATEAYPSGLNLTYAYNDIGALETISDGTNTIVTYAYQGARLQTATFQSGATQTNSYTGYRGEISSIHHQTSASATIERMDYGYDANHDRLYERFGASGSAGDGFAYDKLRRLTTAWMGSATPSAPSSAAYVEKIDFNMDDDGNRTSVVKTPYGQSATTDTYTTNSLNQYTAAAGATHVHDANGNLTDNGTYLFKYDYRNQLIQVRLKSTSAVVADYKFDVLGRRVEKALSASSERYVLSGLETIEVRGTTGGWRQRYVFRDVIDGIVMLEQADVLDFDSDSDTSELTRSFYHSNALGSVMRVTDMNEAEAVSYRYAPYGTPTITVGGAPQSSDPLGQLWGFTARQLDGETASWHYRARGYSHDSGRFSQRDLLGYGPGPNLYEYASSAPAVYTDPLGLYPQPKWWKDLKYMACMAAEPGVYLKDVPAITSMTERGQREAARSGLSNLPDGELDAFRHCLASCYLCKRFGKNARKAEHVMRAHENCTGSTGLPRQMDLQNNATGAYRCCRSSKTTCYECCLGMLQRGQLMTITYRLIVRIRFWGSEKNLFFLPEVNEGRPRDHINPRDHRRPPGPEPKP